MKKVSLLKITVAAAALAAVTFANNTVQAGSATGTANAAIATALTVAETTQLNFGKVESPSGAAGTIVLAPAGGTTDTGLTRLSGVSAAAGLFTLAGENSATYAVSTIADTTISNGGSNPMNVTAFTNNATGSLDGSGAGTFNVGATLTVPDGHPAGTYSGSYTVTVNYN